MKRAGLCTRVSALGQNPETQAFPVLLVHQCRRCDGCLWRSNPSWPGPRRGWLQVAGAGSRTDRRRPQRYLCYRRDPLRDVSQLLANAMIPVGRGGWVRWGRGTLQRSEIIPKRIKFELQATIWLQRRKYFSQTFVAQISPKAPSRSRSSNRSPPPVAASLCTRRRYAPHESIPDRAAAVRPSG